MKSAYVLLETKLFSFIIKTDAAFFKLIFYYLINLVLPNILIAIYIKETFKTVIFNVLNMDIRKYLFKKVKKNIKFHIHFYCLLLYHD